MRFVAVKSPEQQKCDDAASGATGPDSTSHTSQQRHPIASCILPSLASFRRSVAKVSSVSYKLSRIPIIRTCQPSASLPRNAGGAAASGQSQGTSGATDLFLLRGDKSDCDRSAQSRMRLPPSLSSTAGWRTTTPCIRIPDWATDHPASTFFPNPLRVRLDGVNSTITVAVQCYVIKVKAELPAPP